jgi:branched-chain amino acid transport system ATP-binding protein
MSEPILELKNLTRSFGGICAVDDVTLQIMPGEIVGLIGPNGAGKTTLVNLISGFLSASSGQVIFNGEDITRLKPQRIARKGIARTFQIVQPFAQMTVLENVMAAALFAGGASLGQAREQAIEHLEFTNLAHMRDRPANELALANRKRLELAKSIAMNPRILMLDEVNAGLNTSEIEDALAMIRRIAETGKSIIVIEHLMRVVASLAQRVVVLHRGAILSQGTTAEVFEDQNVIEAYLGSRFAQKGRAPV